ncbi:DivIVA domain-containing protein [Micromonospora sp. NPDC051925]|uniref:DivIVA domain-containing protein n=1 Tax=Micromonospora sp. NPDC051925 TaxID=3364288 RepID=UPI0037CA0B40
MGKTLLILVVALTVAAVVFGVTVLISGRDGLAPTEPDDGAVPLPGGRPLRESDVGVLRFDTALRGYRMAQVDQAMRRAAYDIGYKTELIGVLEAEIAALREGRTADADVLRRTREEAAGSPPDDSPATPAADAPAAAPAAEGPTVEVGSAEPVTAPVARTVRSAAAEPAAKPAGSTDATTGSATPATAPADDRSEAEGTDADRAEDRPGGAVVRSESV